MSLPQASRRPVRIEQLNLMAGAYKAPQPRTKRNYPVTKETQHYFLRAALYMQKKQWNIQEDARGDVVYDAGYRSRPTVGPSDRATFSLTPKDLIANTGKWAVLNCVSWTRRAAYTNACEMRTCQYKMLDLEIQDFSMLRIVV